MATEDERGGRVRTIGIVVIATLAAVAGLYFGREFFVPIAFAVLLNALFCPVVLALKKARVPAPVGATIVVLGLVGLLFAGGLALSVPVRAWAAEAPQKLDAARDKLARFREKERKVKEIVAKVASVGDGGPATAPASQPASQPSAAGQPAAAPAAVDSVAPRQEVQPAPAEPAGLVASVVGGTTKILGGVTEVLVLLLLLLAGGGMFQQKLVKVLRRPRDKDLAVEIVAESEAVVVRYLLVTLLINLGQAAVVTLVMWWIGMPNPLLWGLFTVVLEFVPYLGAAIMMAMLSVAAIATFDSFGRMLLAPGSYLVITSLQNNLVSPIAYGNRLKLNPLAVLIGVLFWWFVWGIPGAFLAVPIVATIKVIADRIDALKPIGEFLGE